MRPDTQTRLVGVIGWPVEHSLSPAMHNAALAEMGLNWIYLAFAVQPDHVGEAVRAVRALGLVGLNVTIPHKAAVIDHLDEIDDTASALGAVNTIVRAEDGRLIGHNTDGPGFVRSLQEQGHELQGAAVTIIGAGGSARSVAYACAREGASGITIINRTPQRAEQLADLVRETTGLSEVASGPLDGTARRAVEGADVVVDCTSVGMYPNTDVEPVVPGEWLRSGQVVVDLTYNPIDTVMLQAARAAGAEAVDGAGMLVHQGAISLQHWSGQQPPVETMRRALLRELGAL
ncbi:MAG: shikimate dehydrogenase [Armatimonadota bacterium]|nr:shikimate dehydrogenase [Armatimonadota bacterium]